MRYITVLVAAVVLIGSARHAWSAEAQAASAPITLQRPATYVMADAAPSAEILVQRVLDALAANDAKAFRRLRVTETEYREFIVPGSAKPGQSPQALAATDSEFYWQMLNTKSAYTEAAIMKVHGGKRYALKKVEYAKGHRQYAWFDAYATTVLTLEDPAGQETELVLGSIAHVDGQYKFVGLNGDR